MPTPQQQLPPSGQEKHLTLSTGVIVPGRCQYDQPDASDRVWWLSLPDADSSVDEADVLLWSEPV